MVEALYILWMQVCFQLRPRCETPPTHTVGLNYQASSCQSQKPVLAWLGRAQVQTSELPGASGPSWSGITDGKKGAPAAAAGAEPANLAPACEWEILVLSS
jgi:hypothetical protein